LFMAALATGSAALLLLGIARGSRHVFESLERRYHSRMHGLSIQSFQLVRAESIWRGMHGALATLRILLIVAVVYALCVFSLRQFPWTRGVAAQLTQLVVAPLQSIAVGVLRYIPKLAFLVVLIVLIRYLLKLLALFFDAVRAGRLPVRSFDAEWAQPTYQLARILIVLLALIVAYPYLPGSGSAAFQGLSIFAGLMLSLGASSAMASIIAGYTVTYRRAFHVGDRITVGDVTGEVTQLRLMVTHLRTVKNEEVIVPNSQVLQSHIVNFSKLARTQGLILHTTVALGYEIPWRQAEAMLVLAAHRTSALRADPPPFVLEKSLGEFAVTYELNVCVDSAAGMQERYAELHRNILDVFNEYGVQIMTPAYEGDPPQPKVVASDQWFRAPARRPDEPRSGEGAAARHAS
jgi:small-conductance mechanosensitive channel